MKKELNQCDGCARGIPVVDGTHHDGQGMGIGCSKDRYLDEDYEQVGAWDLMDMGLAHLVGDSVEEYVRKIESLSERRMTIIIGGLLDEDNLEKQNKAINLYKQIK